MIASDYSITDDGSFPCGPATDTATVYIVIGGCVANADTGLTCIDQPFSGNVLINDIDGVAVTTVGAIPTLQGGVAVMQSNGDYTYTSAAGYVGDDSFVYTMENTSGLTCSANATITVVTSIGGVPCI